MQFIIPIVLIAVLVIANVTTRDMKPKTETHPSVTPTATPTATTMPTFPASLSIKITITQSSPTPTPTPPQNAANNSNWTYPGATINVQGSGNLSLSSNDNSTTITNWYKDKIKTMGMNATSFVTTSTNDNILNKLAAAKGTSKVNIEIKKDSGSSITTIIVTF